MNASSSGSGSGPTDEGLSLNYPRYFDEAMAFFLHSLLSEIATRGMPGAHHLLIGFRTGFEHVALSERLRKEYPHEMRIVLQHRFDSLVVEPTAFSVTLEFGKRRERIAVPFAAITDFADPSVPIAYRFVRLQNKKEETVANREEREAKISLVKGEKVEPVRGDIVELDRYRRKAEPSSAKPEGALPDDDEKGPA